MIKDVKPYKRSVVFSGGGTRFVLYCGIYAAMLEHDLKPDNIIATCGAAISSAIIQTFPDPKDILSYLESEEFCNFVMDVQMTNQIRLDKLPLYCFNHAFKNKKAPVLLDIYNKYFMEMTQDMSTILPSLNHIDKNAPSSIVLGAKINYSPEEIGSKRNNKKLFQKVWIPSANCNITYLEHLASLDNSTDKDSAIAPTPIILNDVSPLQAARISMSDMFYVAPAQYKGSHYLGGAIDLVPVELALALADQVWIEKKDPYKKFEEGLVNTVFGYSGNKRLEQINQFQVNQIDTTNVKQALAGHYVSRTWDWRKLRLSLSKPTSIQQCREDIKHIFDYGYQSFIKTL